MFNFNTYFKNIAISLKEQLHTESNIHFNRISSITELEEFIANSRKLSGYQMLILDKDNGKLDDSSLSDNLIDRHFHSFFILKKAASGDFSEIEKTKSGCKIIAKKIMSKMFKDKRECTNGLKDLQRSTFTYSSIGPLTHGYWGIMVNFTAYENANIIYETLDWI